MSNAPLLLVGGAIAAVAVYFITKSKAPTVAAREDLQRAMAGGQMRMKRVTMDDPPLQGSMVAEVCNIKRSRTWTKENPSFVLDCQSGIVPGFSHQYPFTDNRGGSPYKGQVLYRPGPNPNAPYPSDFVETTQGIASLLDILGKTAVDAVKINRQGQQRPAAIPMMMRAPQQQQSNNTLLIVVLLGGVAIAGAVFMMNKQKEA